MHRPQRMKSACRIAAAATLVLAALGCAGTSNQSQGPTPAVSDSGDAEAGETGREAAIYAAVVRQLVTNDHTFGSDPGFKIVYVLDGVVENAADPSKPVNRHDPKEPFTHDVKDGVRFLSELAGLPPVEFIADRDSVVVGERPDSDPGHVKNGGVLISLGPIDADAGSVEVETSLWINGLAGQWLTYVLERKGEAWIITGTTGPMAIS
jgi:hypothetical protein